MRRYRKSTSVTDDDSTSLPPSEAFALFADETRVAIVEALAERATAEGTDGLTFAELRRAIGVRDAGQFNYHLSKLRDRFVVKRDGKYHARWSALKLVGAIRAGTFTESPGSRTAALEHDCPSCEQSLTGAFDHGLVWMECDEHGKLFQTSVAPQAAANRSIPELVAFANAETQHDIERAVSGTCSMCSGPMQVSTPHRPDHGTLIVEFDCLSCWMRIQLPVALTVVRHPAVVAHFHERGVDVRKEPFTSFEFIKDDSLTAVVSEEPYRVRVALDSDEDTTTLTLDEVMSVVNVE